MLVKPVQYSLLNIEQGVQANNQGLSSHQNISSLDYSQQFYTLTKNVQSNIYEDQQKNKFNLLNSNHRQLPINKENFPSPIKFSTHNKPENQRPKPTISSQRGDHNTQIKETAERLNNNLQVIESLNKSKLERSKSRRKFQMVNRSLQLPQKSVKNKLINQINLKLRSISKDSRIGNTVYEEKENSEKLSVKRNLEPYYKELPTSKSILEIELSHCENMLSSIKKRQQENYSLIYKAKSSKQLIDRSSVRNVQSFELQGSKFGSRFRNKINQEKQHRRERSNTNIQIEYVQYGEYRYPKYIKPVGMYFQSLTNSLSKDKVYQKKTEEVYHSSINHIPISKKIHTANKSRYESPIHSKYSSRSGYKTSDNLIKHSHPKVRFQTKNYQ